MDQKFERRRGAGAVGGVLATALFGAMLGSSCGTDEAALLPDRVGMGALPGAELVARLVHVTDTHAVDASSPARFASAAGVIPSAWRAWESSSTQLLDGVVREINRVHMGGERVDFVLHTGDTCDNVQANELTWFVQVMDGEEVQPLSGPDDRDGEGLPPVELDPYAPFQAEGLNWPARLGGLPIPWYVAIGNHDVFAVGVFAVITRWDGARIAPLPLNLRPGVVLPVMLDPTGSLSYGPVSPAFPGPPPLLNFPARVEANAQRQFFTKREFVEAMFRSRGLPAGHGFDGLDGPTWYSVSPVAGLRLITLDTSDIVGPATGFPYWQGCISAEQRAFLERELARAVAAGEWVIVATHAPSVALETAYGSSLDPQGFRDLLNNCPNVVAHFAGHLHRNRVVERGNYIEIETCSTLDWPQEARIVELWREPGGGMSVVYRMIPAAGEDAVSDDPLRGLRNQAHAMANPAKNTSNRRLAEPVDPNPRGNVVDREGTWHRAGHPAGTNDAVTR